MIAWLIATLGLLIAGVACLAHADSGDMLAVTGWALLALSFVTLAAGLPVDDE